jgi:hypothetical protein
MNHIENSEAMKWTCQQAKKTMVAQPTGICVSGQTKSERLEVADECVEHDPNGKNGPAARRRGF